LHFEGSHLLLQADLYNLTNHTQFGGIGTVFGSSTFGTVSTQANNPRDAIRRGIALIPEDRKTEGLLLPLPVRQNLTLLIDHGAPAPTLDCVSCWGATLGGISDPARAALGITADGRLIWAGGEHLTVADLARALLGAHVVRAVELDINPEWVAAYLYGRRGGKGPLAPVPMVPGQPGVPGQFLIPYSRDFFTIVAR